MLVQVTHVLLSQHVDYREQKHRLVHDRLSVDEQDRGDDELRTHVQLFVLSRQSHRQLFGPRPSDLVFELDDGEEQSEELHLECLVGFGVHVLVVEVDDRLADVDRLVLLSVGSLSRIVNVRED